MCGVTNYKNGLNEMYSYIFDQILSASTGSNRDWVLIDDAVMLLFLDGDDVISQGQVDKKHEE